MSHSGSYVRLRPEVTVEQWCVGGATPRARVALPQLWSGSVRAADSSELGEHLGHPDTPLAVLVDADAHVRVLGVEDVGAVAG